MEPSNTPPERLNNSAKAAATASWHPHHGEVMVRYQPEPNPEILMQLPGSAPQRLAFGKSAEERINNSSSAVLGRSISVKRHLMQHRPHSQRPCDISQHNVTIPHAGHNGRIAMHQLGGSSSVFPNHAPHSSLYRHSELPGRMGRHIPVGVPQHRHQPPQRIHFHPHHQRHHNPHSQRSHHLTWKSNQAELERQNSPSRNRQVIRHTSQQPQLVHLHQAHPQRRSHPASHQPNAMRTTTAQRRMYLPTQQPEQNNRQDGPPQRSPPRPEVPVAVSSEDSSGTPPSHRKTPEEKLPSPLDPAAITATPHNHNGKRAALIYSPATQQAMKRPKGLDRLDLLVEATLEIGPLAENPTGCSCPKSKCIALYCDCFKAGRRCDPNTCNCLDCKNTINESGPHGARTKAIRGILARNPRAFQVQQQGASGKLNQKNDGEMACNCLRSRCLKLYCTCFQTGKICQEGVCTCVACLNMDVNHPERKLAVQQTLQKRPDAFEIKTKVVGQGCACKNNRCVRKYCECFRINQACTSKCSCIKCENGKPARNSTSIRNDIVLGKDESAVLPPPASNKVLSEVEASPPAFTTAQLNDSTPESAPVLAARREIFTPTTANEETAVIQVSAAV